MSALNLFDQKGALKTFLEGVFFKRNLTWKQELDVESFLHIVRVHCLEPLLYHKTYGTDLWQEWPEKVQTRLAEEYQNQSIIDAVREEELTLFFKELHQQAIPFILLKGTALAYSVYDSSVLRPRLDTDIWIREEDAQKTRKILEALDFNCNHLITGSLANYQFMASKRDSMGIALSYDIHWKLSNPQKFSNFLTFDTAYKSSEEIDLGKARVRILSPKDALLHALVHRATHHKNEEKLIWFYDIFLLVQKIGIENLNHFLSYAKSKNLYEISARGLLDTQAWFYFDLSKVDLDNLSENLELGVPEKPRLIHRIASDLKELSWSKKLRLVFELLFPASDFMLSKYEVSSKLWLPLLYFWRLFCGLWRVFRKI